jgi:RNA polymerase sigma factor (sigma-70 family)
MGLVVNLHDARLVGRALRQETGAFEALVHRHMSAVSAVALAYTGNHADAEDVAQEVFLKAWQSLDTLRTPRRFGGWVVTIARNVARAKLNRQRREAVSLEQYRKEAPMPHSSGVHDSREALRELVPGLVAELADSDRELVLLRYYGGKKTREIAALMAMSHAAVRKRLERVRAKLGRALLASLKADETEATRRDSRAAQIASAVVAAPPGWRTAAASKASMLGGSLLVKGGVVGLIAVAALVTGHAIMHRGMAKEPGATRLAAQTVSAEVSQKTEIRASTLTVPDDVASSEPAGMASEPEDASAAAEATEEVLGSISGRLYETDTGNGVEGGVITLRRVAEAEATTTETDAKGLFCFERLAPGEYWVQLTEDDGFRWRYPRARYVNQERKVLVEPSGEEAVIEFTVVRGLTVRGRVVGPDRQALPGIAVNAWSEPNEVEAETTTDDQGCFVFHGFGTNLPVVLWPHCEGLAMPPYGPVSVPAEGIDDLVLTMGPESVITGRLVDQDGNPLEGAKVRPWMRGMHVLYHEHFGVANAQGRFEIRGLHEATYRMDVQLPDWSSARVASEPEEVTLGAGEHLRDLDVVYEFPGALTISGRVTDDTGRPLDRVRMDIYRDDVVRTSETDAQGYYEAADLAPGIYEVHAHAINWNRSGQYTAQAEAGEQNVDLVIPRNGTVRGQVVDAETGVPITAFEVRVPGPAMRWTGFEHPEGRFEIPSLRPDASQSVCARAEGYAMGTAERFSLEPGQVREDVVVKLETSGGVTGQVTGPDGAAVRDAKVTITDGRFGDPTRSAADGSFVLTGARPGEWDLTVFHPDYAPASVSISVAAREETRVDVQLGTGASLRGTVRSQGEPLADVRVELVQRLSENEVGYSKECTTDKDGGYLFKGVPSGELLLHLNPMFGQQGRIIDSPVVFSAAEEKEVDIDVHSSELWAEFDVVIEDALASQDGIVYVELAYFFGYGEKETFYAYVFQNEPVRLDSLRTGEATLNARLHGPGYRTCLSVAPERQVLIREGVENRFVLEFVADGEG